jgi:hypothetical protein
MWKCVPVVHTMDHWWLPDDGIHEMPKHIQDFLCIFGAYIPEHLKSVLYSDFHTMQGIRNIKIESVHCEVWAKTEETVMI